MSLGLFATLPAAQAPAAPAANATAIIDYFQNPDVNSKPMVRMWFPDAAAGADNQDDIAKQIQALAAAGFGGVEVAMLRDGSDLGMADQNDSAIYGWGSPNWSNLLKKVLKAADAIKDGFQVDITITAHWPPTLNTIDPNDPSASQQESYSFTKLTAADLSSNSVNLTLPATKTVIPGNAGPGSSANAATTNFIYTDSFVSAAVARVSDIVLVPGQPATQFSPATPHKYQHQLDFNSLKPIADSAVSSSALHSAGVPDQAAFDAYNLGASGGTYQTNVVDFFGPDPTDSCDYTNGQAVAAGTGKQDAANLRCRMADEQYAYQASLGGLNLDLNAQSAGSEIQKGDYVVVSTFVQGTGQNVGGSAKIMPYGAFVTNYFNTAGTRSVLDYWNGMFASDPELLSLMQNAKVPGYIFEDSIEASSTTSYWTSTLKQDMSLPAGYAYAGILPIVAASQYTSAGFTGSTTTNFFSFSNDNGLVARIYQDYNDQMGQLYAKDRVSGVSAWAHNTIGWGFRGQTYQLPGSEIANAASIADVPETDNSTKGDGVRYQAGTVNVTGKQFLTMEAMTGLTVTLATMGDILTEAGQNYSDGVSRLILHGSPYAKTYDGYNSDWPGWLPFGPNSFGDAYTYREPYWSDITTETGYMARNQAIIQKGTAKIDLAMFIDRLSTFDFTSGNSFQDLLDNGYSYNLLSDATLGSDVTGGRLDPAGPAYKALVVDQVSTISVDSAQKILDDAKAGLPVIVYNSDPKQVYGSATAQDATVAGLFDQLKALPNVKTVASEDQVLPALRALSVTPYAVYNQAQLETTLYTDPVDGTSYYYMYNNANPTNSGMMANHAGTKYKGDDKAISQVSVTLAGTGVPYKLDAHSGEISQVGNYTVNANGTVSFTIDQLAGGDSVIYALTSNTTDFPAPTVYATSVTPDSGASIVRTADNGLALRSTTAGSYTVTTSAQGSSTVNLTGGLATLDLSGQPWHLVIDSYGPQYEHSSQIYPTEGAAAWASVDPSESKITTVDFGQQSLINWEDIDATPAQLDALGVPDMMYVSGVGHYSTTFTTPASWVAGTGAYLDLSYGWDQIGSITVNSTTFTANNASDRIDIGSALVAGQNNIEIKLSTTLFARTFLENSGYDSGNGTIEPVVTGGFGGGGTQAYNNGLLGVSLTPYSQVSLDITSPAPPQLTAPRAGALLNNPKPGIAGQAEAGSAITVKDGAGTIVCTAQADQTGGFSCTPRANLANGQVTLSVTATDAAGNVSAPATVAFGIDTVSPAAPVITTANASVIAGTAEAGGTVSVTVPGVKDPVTAVVDSNGHWSVSTPAGAVNGSVSVIVTDQAGNVSPTASASLNLSVKPPVASTGGSVVPSSGSVAYGLLAWLIAGLTGAAWVVRTRRTSR